MQNRNFVKIFAILFAIVCLYQLSFTWVSGGIEEDAVAYEVPNAAVANEVLILLLMVEVEIQVQIIVEILSIDQ